MISRITLMTVTFLSAGYSCSVTENSVCSSTTAAAAARRSGGGSGHRRGGGHAELLLQVGDQVDNFEDGQLGDRVDDIFFGNGH